jgi:hypothetical protein
MATAPITPASISSGPSTTERAAQILSLLQQYEAPLRDEAVGALIKEKSEPTGVPRNSTGDLQRNFLSIGAADHSPKPLQPNNFLFGVKDNPIPITGRF